MSIIFDTLRNYAARTNDRQNDYDNTTVYNQRICSGWGYIVGNGTSYLKTKAISFPITFDDVPIVTISNLGTTDNLPNDPSDFHYTRNHISYVTDCTTTGFKAVIVRFSRNGNDPGALINNRYYGFSWIAIGTFDDYEL